MCSMARISFHPPRNEQERLKAEGDFPSTSRGSAIEPTDRKLK